MTHARSFNRIAVLVSIARHRVSGAACYSRNDALALHIGRALAHQHGAMLDVFHAGHVEMCTSSALEDYLALGASHIEVLECGEKEDAVSVLAQRVQDCDLILTGMRAQGASDSGILPYRLAAALGFTLLNAAAEISVSSTVINQRVEIVQFLPKGLRRRIDAALPAVITVHPQANATPRYAYARLKAGSITYCNTSHSQRAADVAEWNVFPAATRKPVKLAAQEKRSAQARMHLATTTENRGGNVVIHGTPLEKAHEILDYLRKHHLINY